MGGHLAVLMLRNHLVHLRQEVDAAKYVIVHMNSNSPQRHILRPQGMFLAQCCTALQFRPLHGK